MDSVLHGVAEHPNTPVELLIELASPKWASTHLSLSTNPSAPPEVLSALAGSGDTSTLEHVIWHPKTPLEDLRRLAEHERPHVRRWAQDSLTRRGVRQS